ncbi:hypothetical protein CDAR_54491 [Caerostris darwini]|uniref:Uncharacterized protein n=1 Tax=Caerostris darwini TaxID=1538125 RepID=A0AAV4T1J4_9ARAC|nr:hypothetical protein CDAR_54491 [Caerostris darwini]
MQIETVITEDDGVGLPSSRMIERSVEVFEEMGRSECLFPVGSGDLLFREVSLAFQSLQPLAHCRGTTSRILPFRKIIPRKGKENWSTKK